MRRHNKQLLAAACELLLRRWQTCSLVSEASKPVPSEFDCLTTAATLLQTPASMNEFMCNVVLPLPVHAQAFADALQTTLRSSHNLSAVFGSVVARIAPIEGFRRVFFVRLSAQVYLELSDFDALAEAVARVLEEGAAFYCTATEFAP